MGNLGLENVTGYRCLNYREIGNRNPTTRENMSYWGVKMATEDIPAIGDQNLVTGNRNKRNSYVRQPHHVSCATHQLHSDTCFFFPQLLFLPVAVFSLFSGETAHRRLHHTGSPSPRERGRKKKREEEEEERGRKKKRREEEEEAERKGEEERKEEEEERGRRRERKEEEEEEGRRRSREGRKKKREEGRKKKKKQSCEKASPEEEIGFVGEHSDRKEEELRKKKTRVAVRLVGRTGHVVRLSHVRFSPETIDITYVSSVFS
ncbi:hypothetical protein ACLB2K_022929 [Fragaria x ananassa]